MPKAKKKNKEVSISPSSRSHKLAVRMAVCGVNYSDLSKAYGESLASVTMLIKKDARRIQTKTLGKIGRWLGMTPTQVLEFDKWDGILNPIPEDILEWKEKKDKEQWSTIRSELSKGRTG